MSDLQSFVLLMSIAILLVAIAQRLRVSYPMALVVGGGIIGFMPAFSNLYIDPHTLLIIVLPPILFHASFWMPFREFRQNWRDIFSLALSLVFATTLIVGIIFKWLFPQFPWALAFAFGAIISPPDAAAATAILKRFAIGPRLLTVLEGESLVNDASGLVLYKITVTALLTGVFSWHEAGVEFIKTVAGGILVGGFIGLVLQLFSKRFLEPVVGVIFSLMIPYLAYLSAEALDVSGVLAVVVCGLIASPIIIRHFSALRRVVGIVVWDIYVLLLNALVFILIGSELSRISQWMTIEQMVLYTAYGMAFTLVIIAVRLLWVYMRSSIYFLRMRLHCNRALSEERIFADATLLGWSGMRGIVSLTIALALPQTLSDGMLLVGRAEVVYMTFVVILLSLFIPGLTLTHLIHWLKIHHVQEIHIVKKIRSHLVKIAEDEVNRLHAEEKLTNEDATFLLTYFNVRKRILEISSTLEEKTSTLELARVEILQIQRNYLIHKWEKGEINDSLLKMLEREIDMADAHLARAEI